MLKHIIRIENHILRIFLLALVFKFYYIWYILKAALPVSWGGHPNGSRLLELDFYLMPIDYLIAGLRGDFVPKECV